MQPDFCIDFLNRKCQLTKRTCKNVHVTSEHRELLKRVCIKYLSGRCDSKACYEHKSLKQLKIPTPQTYYELVPIEDYTNAKFCRTYLIRHKCSGKCNDIHPINRDIIEMRKCCLDFLLDGRCTTPGCTKPHKTYADIDVWPPSAYPNKYPKIEICVDWLNGKCRDNEADCKWIHVESNHIKLLTKNSNHEEMLRMHLGVSIRDYEYKFPPVSPLADEPVTNGNTTTPVAPKNSPSVPAVTTVKPAPQSISSPQPQLHAQTAPQPLAIPQTLSPPPPLNVNVNVEQNLPLDQLLSRLISTLMELKQMYVSEHASRHVAEGEIARLKHKLNDEKATLRAEEEKLIKYFFIDVVVGEEYRGLTDGKFADELPSDARSLLLGPLADAIAPLQNGHDSKYNGAVEDNSYKIRAQQLCQTLRLLIRQFNPDTFPLIVNELAAQRRELENQVKVLTKSIEDLQMEKAAIRQKYQYATAPDPLQYLSASEIEVLDSQLRRDSDRILTNIATSVYCIICQERPRVMVLVPCGHLEYCEDCVNTIDHCASCRSPIMHRLKVKR